MIINKLLLNRNQNYTYCKIISEEGAVNGGPDYYIVYYVDGKECKGFISQDSRYNIRVGDCYEIKYYPPNPNICELNLDRPVKCE